MEYSPEEATGHEGNTQSPAKKKPSVKKKRVRSLNSSSTVLQRRRRAVILSLREQATKLQEVVLEFSSGDAKSDILKLDEKTCADSKAQEPSLSRWHRCAVEEYDMRINSEKQNRQLKRILIQQKTTITSLRRVLRRQSLNQEMDFLKQESCVHLHGSLADSYVCRSMTHLQNTVENLYQHSTLQFDAGSTPFLSSPVQTSYREQRKNDAVEFIVSTPMSCSMAGASNLILSNLETERTPGIKPGAMQHIQSLTLYQLDKALQFDKLHYIRKFSEPEKVTLVCSDIVLLRSTGLKFFSKGYTAIMSLPADSHHTCVVHTVLELRVDNEAGQQSSFAADVALGALSKAIRLFWQSQQVSLTDEAARISGGSTYVSCCRSNLPAP